MERNWLKRELNFSFFVDSGLLFKMNQELNCLGITLIAVKKTNGEFDLKFKDDRANPEKAIFSSESVTKGKKKFSKFIEEFGNSQIERRRLKLGYCVQDS